METIDLTDIESYLDKIQQLNLSDDHERVLKTINDYKKQCTDSVLRTFFSAEEAFYQKNYKPALQNYLRVSTLPFYEFFCFRASAYASETLNNYLKAIQFAKKALHVRPDDYPTLSVLANIYACIDQRDKAVVINKKLNLLKKEKKQYSPPVPENDETHHFIPVGEKELEELSQIFSNKGKSESELFTNEGPTSSIGHSYETDITPITDDTIDQDPVVMPPGCDLFSHSPKPWENEEGLTKRLYSITNDSSLSSTYVKEGKSQLNNVLLQYHGLYQKNRQTKINYFLCLSGRKSDAQNSSFLSMVEIGKGSFINSNGRGIAVNPGDHFLENLHNNGLYIQDIHTVIVSSSAPDSYQELKNLYYLSNGLASEKLAPPIQFYLHPAVYRELNDCFPTNTQLQILPNQWNEYENTKFKTFFEDGQILGVLISIAEREKRTNLFFLNSTNVTHLPKDSPKIDVLISDTNSNPIPLINAIEPKVAVLQNLRNITFSKPIDNFLAVQKNVAGKTKLLPSEVGLNFDLTTLNVYMNDELSSFSLGELCVAQTISSEIVICTPST